MTYKTNQYSYEDYIKNNNKKDLHPEISKIIDILPNNIEQLHNMIVYGPSGVGKYTQALRIINKYSTNNLKYEKRIIIEHHEKKQLYNLKISDIHFEVDMELLGVNSKTLWNDIYNQIVDIVSSRQHNTGIILCKNFHNIHSELLEIFYSYIQNVNNNNIIIKYILISEHISFIPDNIINISKIIDIKRPTKTLYNKCISNSSVKINDIKDIDNIRNLTQNVSNLNRPYDSLIDNIIDMLIDYKKFKLIHFREQIYDLFIYDINISQFIWLILKTLIDKKYITNDNINIILKQTYISLKYFNNNYRSIYHIENYLLYIIKNIHGF